MRKFMNSTLPMNLQLFAEDKGGDTGEGGEESEEESEESEESEEDEQEEQEKQFTQEELDEAIKKRLARERKKWLRQQTNQKTESSETKKDDKSDDGKNEETEKALAKADELEVKVACYENGVSKDAVEDVTALARAYMASDEDLDIDEAIEKVVKKYPHFKQSADGDQKQGGKWGERQKGKGGKEKSLADEIEEQLYGN